MNIQARLVFLFFSIIFSFSVIAGEDYYRIDSEDVISVIVYDEPELSKEEVKVSPSGYVSLPLLGEVGIEGLTTSGVAKKIEALLSDGYLRNPRVSVSIIEYRFVYVNGEVKKPGGYSYQKGLTVQRAVTLAGGFTERASDDKITIIHEKEPNKLFKATLRTSVRPGDVISVGESFF